MQGSEIKLHAILEPGVKALGYELLGLKFLRGSKPAILRLYIDHEDGIGLDDCAAVSRQVSGILEVEESISENYNLEVSSPGVDRPLFLADQFQRFSGQAVKLRMHLPIDGRRNFRGRLVGMRDADVAVLVDGVEERLPLADIDTAQLVPEIH